MQKETYIWGAGRYGVLTAQYLKDNGIEIKGFIDKNGKSIKTKLGLPVLEFNDVNERNLKVIIAIQNENAIREIVEILSSTKLEFEISPLIPRSIIPKEYFETRKRQTFALIEILKPLEVKNSPKYIVSLTSYGKRLVDTAPYAIATLLNQSVKPDKIVLWVAHEDKGNIPQIMEKLTEKGLEIRFCEDIKSYKKLIFTLETFPNDYIITADDDIYYPNNWLAQLLTEHKKNPKKIICHRAREIRVDGNYNPIPYLQWNICINENYNYGVFPTGSGGILYPPKSLHKEVMCKDLFMKLAPKADDIWFWATAIINKEYFGEESPYIAIKNGYSKKLQIIEPEQTQEENALWNYNLLVGNDKQLKAVIKQYPQIREYLKRIEPSVYKKSFCDPCFIPKSKSTPPTVSVIIPVYNAAQWLERCFNSIAKQTYDNSKFEAIFIDDCSTDNSVNILEKLIGNYDGEIKFHLLKHSKNNGLARDTGIKNAKCDYVYLMDDDDEISEDCLEALSKLAQKYGDVDVVQGNILRIETNKNGQNFINPNWDISKNNFPEFVSDKLWIKERLAMWTRHNDYIPHSAWNKLVRKEFITRNNLHFGKIQASDDQLWNFWVSKKIQSIAFSNLYTYIYHRDHISITSQTPNRENTVIAHIGLCRTILQNIDWEIACSQIELVQGLISSYIKPELDKNEDLKAKYQKEIESLINSIKIGKEKFNEKTG